MRWEGTVGTGYSKDDLTKIFQKVTPFEAFITERQYGKVEVVMSRKPGSAIVEFDNQDDAVGHCWCLFE